MLSDTSSKQTHNGAGGSCSNPQASGGRGRKTAMTSSQHDLHTPLQTNQDYTVGSYSFKQQ